jgi:hypothetical protein
MSWLSLVQIYKMKWLKITILRFGKSFYFTFLDGKVELLGDKNSRDSSFQEYPIREEDFEVTAIAMLNAWGIIKKSKGSKLEILHL